MNPYFEQIDNAVLELLTNPKQVQRVFSGAFHRLQQDIIARLGRLLIEGTTLREEAIRALLAIKREESIKERLRKAAEGYIVRYLVQCSTQPVPLETTEEMILQSALFND